MKNMRNTQIVDIKEDNFCCFPMISIPLYRVWVQEDEDKPL